MRFVAREVGNLTKNQAYPFDIESSLGPVWVHFGSSFSPVSQKSTLSPFWVHFGSILSPVSKCAGSGMIDFCL